ncbi:MAG: DUF1304 family protein [Pseudomonadota bacterium]
MNVADSLAAIAAILCLVYQALVFPRYFVGWKTLSSNLLGYTSEDARRARPLATMIGIFNVFIFLGLAMPWFALQFSELRMDYAGGLNVQVFALVMMLAVGAVAFVTEHHPREPSITRRSMFLAQALLAAIALILLGWARYLGG